MAAVWPAGTLLRVRNVWGGKREGGCVLGEVELDGAGVEDGLAGFEDDAAAGCDGHGGYAAVVVGGVAADEGGGDVGYGAVGLEVVGLADILPGRGAADGVEGV